jgi:adenylate cyclase
LICSPDCYLRYDDGSGATTSDTRAGATMTEAVHAGPISQRQTRLGLVLGVAWAVLVALGLIILSLANYLPEGPDEWTYDWRTFFFSPAAREPRKDIAVILINDNSLAEYDYVSPVDRGLIATLLKALDASEPRAIGLDFIYDRKSDEAKTRQLIDTIRTVKSPIVFGAIDLRVKGFTQENVDYQERFIKATGRDAGHVFFAREEEQLKIGDQVVRYMGDSSEKWPRKSFAERIAENAGAAPFQPAMPYIAWLLPPDGNDDLFTLFRVPRHAPGSAPEAVLPPSWGRALKDKIVLIGGDFVDRDRHLTPMSVWDSAKMPGVLVQAQILAQLVDGRSIHTFAWQYEAMMLAIVAFLGFLFTRRWETKRYDWVLYGTGLVILVVLGIVLFHVFSIIAPTTTLFFAWTLGVTGGHYVPKLMRRLHMPA